VRVAEKKFHSESNWCRSRRPKKDITVSALLAFICGSHIRIYLGCTFKPVVFNKPVEDAKTIKSIERCVLESWIALSRTNDSLPNAADYTSVYENVLGHGGTIRDTCRENFYWTSDASQNASTRFSRQ
jgi:hypothetical protein